MTFYVTTTFEFPVIGSNRRLLAAMTTRASLFGFSSESRQRVSRISPQSLLVHWRRSDAETSLHLSAAQT